MIERPEYQPQGLAAEIFTKRYALYPEETWYDACNRVADFVSKAEAGADTAAYHKKFQHILVSGLFAPGGRIMYGSGRPRGQLLNCFVVPTSDSREGWGALAYDTLVISGTGGGVGTNYSPVRPRGSDIRGTGGTATGSTSLMSIVNAEGEEIKAGGGRRTALMMALEHDHPDIEEFLNKKLDLGKLNNANVSVIFDKNPEKFFDQVRKGENVKLVFGGRTVKELPAKVLWDKIISNALKGGEPGVLNGCYANRMSNISYCAKLICTNPCQPASATVLTPSGIRTFADIDVGSTIWSGTRWTHVVRKELTGIKQVIAYKTRAGVFLGTKNHRILQRGEKIEVGEADAIDLTVGPRAPVTPLDPRDIMDGLVLGDGTTHHASNDLTVLLIGDDDGEYHTSEVKHLIGRPREALKPKAWEVETSLASLPLTYERFVPARFLTGKSSTVRGFLRGLYTANGSVVGGRVTLKAASLRVVEAAQVMLSSLGISSYYTVNKPQTVAFANGSYDCRQSYDLNIGTHAGRSAFRDLIGFIQSSKTDKLEKTLLCAPASKPAKVSYEIVEIEEHGTEEVFSITVEDAAHMYWTGGLQVANCGEIWLSEYDCCCLGAVVLPRFVHNGDIQWDELAETVRLGVRFLDDVLTVNTYPLPEIKDVCSSLRRIGLGVMGLHDMLLMLGMKYTTDRALEKVEEVMAFIKNTAYEASIDLANEKGPFPKFRAEEFLKGGFAKTLKPSLRTKIAEHGIRNCAILTIAPTGTTSMVQNVTSGIEPMFAPAYRRKFRDGEELREEVVVHPLFQQFVAEGRSVKHFQGAYQLKLRDHFEMQRICQKHLDNACSKTINVLPGTSAEELSDLYMEFLPELKGLTVYPEGSREDQP